MSLNNLNLAHYYFPLFLAVVIGLFGIWVLRHLPDGNEHKTARRDQRIGGWLLVTLGLLWGGGIVCCTPPPWERSRYVKFILTLQPDDFERIVIIPEPDPKSAYTGPFLNEVVFDDRASIRAICAALRTAEGDSTGNYQKVWRCKLRLVLSDGTYECRVEKDWMNQSFVCFQIDGGFIGQLRCDELGNLLEWIPRPSDEDK